MAISHAAPGEPIDVRPLGPRLGQEKTIALFKSDHLEVLRLVLPAGKSMPAHKVTGEMTIQCLEGSLAVTGDGPDTVLNAGELLYLRGNVVHGLIAREDASVLITLALHR
jgi:quercetin dioxygenase-like cupin family protein